MGKAIGCGSFTKRPERKKMVNTGVVIKKEDGKVFMHTDWEVGNAVQAVKLARAFRRSLNQLKVEPIDATVIFRIDDATPCKCGCQIDDAYAYHCKHGSTDQSLGFCYYPLIDDREECCDDGVPWDCWISCVRLKDDSKISFDLTFCEADNPLKDFDLPRMIIALAKEYQ